jgi:hypothetical protein
MDIISEIIDQDSSSKHRVIKIKMVLFFNRFFFLYYLSIEVPIVTIVVESSLDTLSTICRDLHARIPVVLINVRSCLNVYLVDFCVYRAVDEYLILRNFWLVQKQ